MRPQPADRPRYAYPEPHAWLRAGFVLCLLAGWVLVEVTTMISLSGSPLIILVTVTAFLCAGAAAAINLTLHSKLTFLPGRRRAARSRANGTTPPLPVTGLTTVNMMLAGSTGWLHVEDAHPDHGQARADAYVHPDEPGPASIRITRTLTGWVTGPAPTGHTQTMGAALTLDDTTEDNPVTVVQVSPATPQETAAHPR